MITQTINLDVVPNGVPPIIHVSQYDTGERKLKFNIVSSAESANLSNASVTISGVKPDGHGFEYEATFSNNVVTASVTEQMTVVAGKVECALTFTTNNGVAQTARFDLEVKPSPINDETIISDTDIPGIIALAREQEAHAAQSANAAAASATAAATSASNAASSEANAATSESNAATSESNAATSEANAATSESNAETSETNASASATAAATSATNAANSANEAAGWCDNNGDSGQSTSSATNNAYYWAQFAQQYATGALIWMGDTTFANIPVSGMSVGNMYNVTDEFTTDSRFNVGVGIVCPAGTNIIWSNTGKWDIQAPPYKSSQISYSNATSGMGASNVQAAIDELSDEVAHAARGVVGTEAEIAAMIARGEIEDGTPVDIIDDEDPDEITSLQVTHGNDTLNNVLNSIDTDLAGKQSQTLLQQIAGQSTVEGALGAIDGKITRFYSTFIDNPASGTVEDALDTWITSLPVNSLYMAFLSGGSGAIIGMRGNLTYQRQIKIDYWGNSIKSRVKTNSSTWTSWFDVAQEHIIWEGSASTGNFGETASIGGKSYSWSDYVVECAYYKGGANRHVIPYYGSGGLICLQVFNIDKTYEANTTVNLFVLLRKR